MKAAKAMRAILSVSFAVLLMGLPEPLLAQTNPCAPKRGKAAANPCAPNPCAPGARGAVNPCAPGGAAQAVGKAVMARGEIVSVDPKANRLVLRSNGKDIPLSLSRYGVVREGPRVKRLAEVKPKEKAIVSLVETPRERTAWYIYLTSAAAANPCAANPCAVKNPCAPKAKKAANPCAANPCAARPAKSR